MKTDEELKHRLPQTMRCASASGHKHHLQRIDEHAFKKTDLGEYGLDATISNEIPTFPELRVPPEEAEEHPGPSRDIQSQKQQADQERDCRTEQLDQGGQKT